MKLGIVGMPNVGKSTLFNAITKAGAVCANYPFCTIEPNVGVVPVPDHRLQVLQQMYKPEKVTHAVIEFVDIAGLVRGASKGEGLGNKFLSHIREVDAIVHVVRCFEDENIIHVDGDVDPVRDLDVVNIELILADIEMLDKRMGKQKQSKSEQHTLFAAIKQLLDSGRPAREYNFTKQEAEIIKEVELLTLKPQIVAANLSESDMAEDYKSNAMYRAVAEYAKNDEIIPVSAKIEEEIVSFDDDAKMEFLSELGLTESGLDRLIQSSYRLLGLISFLTAGPKEVRAWTIKSGSKAPDAAGKIHSDIQRGFIRAEIIAYDDLVSSGGMQAAKEKGLVRSEGKDYVMQDGDVTLFRFNV